MTRQMKDGGATPYMPGFPKSILPIAFLLVTLVLMIVFMGASSIGEWSPYVLLLAAAFSLLLVWRRLPGMKRSLAEGMRRSASQILPAIPILVFISLLSTTWMAGGIVPTFIRYGLEVMNPSFFLATVCLVSACISVLTGSSWTTIATIGVAFMGIGEILGFSAPWIAGAVISGAYFGDKVSPLSDTTVVASSSCGVDLFTHIRYMMLTSGPSMVLALTVFLIEGFLNDYASYDADGGSMIGMLSSAFVINPWLMLFPAVTMVLIVMKVKTVITLAVSSALGLLAMTLFQPAFAFDASVITMLVHGLSFDTPDRAFNDLVSTSGFMGMLPTIFLVLSAMVFGGVMMGTRMIESISLWMTGKIRNRRGAVGATIGSGLLLNGFTADQYLSLIIGANMYKKVYERMSLQPKMLSRSLEDSVSVTSVLIPWNSCGLTQSAVLGVSTLSYLPYCVFNYVSPLVSFLMSAGFVGMRNSIVRRIRKIA